VTLARLDAQSDAECRCFHLQSNGVEAPLL
jgi:hypothetical protein